MGLIGAREVVERRRNCAKGGGGGALGVGLLRAWREGKEGQGRSGEERGCRGTLLRGGESGRRRWGAIMAIWFSGEGKRRG
jgi:hypothetical protein